MWSSGLDLMEELMASIAARKKLSALYAQGCLVRFTPEGPRIANVESLKGRFPEGDDPSEDDVEVWVAPPNPFQRDIALREAQAQRAKALLKVKGDKDSEEYLTTRAFLADMSFETLIEYVLLSSNEERTQSAIREVLADEEWSNIDELRDAMRQYEEAGSPEDDPEWKPLLEADAKYAKAVADAEKRLHDSAREALALIGREELERRALDKRGEIVGSQAFMAEYEKQMRYFSVRDPQAHDKLWFESPNELMEQEDVVQNAIGQALASFIKEAGEAKN